MKKYIKASFFAKIMAEIPSLVWMIIGFFISVISLFLGVLRPVEYSAFFILMLVVGVGMIGFGYIKMSRGRVKADRKFEKKRQMRIQESVVDIDIDDYRNNPELRQRVLNQGGQAPQQQGNYTNPTTQQGKVTRHVQPQQQRNPPLPEKRNSKGRKVCPNCGAPLLDRHDMCPVCNSRI